MNVNELKVYEAELLENFKWLHQHPEIGFYEFKTSEFIQDKLTSYGIDFTTMARTGVVGSIVVDPKAKTFALRADIDALPIEENTDLDYKSTCPGFMHACGHDGHVAMLLAVAKYFSEHRDVLKGNLKFIFQPAEEGIVAEHYDELMAEGINELGGAATMVDQGIMEGIDGIFAIHGDVTKPIGTIGIAQKEAMAASDRFELTIQGKGGHGAMPDTAIDPTGALSAIIAAYNQLPSREFSGLDKIVLTIGEIHMLGTWNAIADKVYLQGTVRTFDEAKREAIFVRMKDLAECIAKAHRCTAELTRFKSTMATINNETMVDLVMRTAHDLLGQDAASMILPPEMGAEDVGNFFNKAPGAMAWLGVKNDKYGTYPLHNPNVVMNPDGYIYGVALHINVVLNYFKEA
ncbi:M20 family metallopeptidase [Peptoniphilus equinus]|uniref:M20 family metallopeptidase n=1 Tax=Peptoniphilus equinus TaxID=3016343 RepID=A0ABY7QRV8_9FIRM|nr:M20 family metallopeptidase [Peptoniphilus equinus]WBW49520.1 M20 family metallopeptidase [Peptoniphilus equinus]